MKQTLDSQRKTGDSKVGSSNEIFRPEAKLTKSGTQSSSVTSNDGTWG